MWTRDAFSDLLEDPVLKGKVKQGLLNLKMKTEIDKDETDRFIGGYLEMWTRDAFSDLLEEGLLNLDELGRLNHVQDLLDLAQEHHLDR